MLVCVDKSIDHGFLFLQERMPKYLEMHWESRVKSARPDQTIHIDTRVTWADVRTWQSQSLGGIDRLRLLWSRFVEFLQVAWRQDYETVITRCLGTIDSYGSMRRHMTKKIINRMFWYAVRFAARNGKKLIVIDMLDQKNIHPADFPLLKRCDLYFKRELASNIVSSFEAITPHESCIGYAFGHRNYAAYAKKLRPISLGVPPGEIRVLDPEIKKWDFFYTGTDSILPDRLRVNAVLDELKTMGYRVLNRIWLKPQEFEDAIHQSWLSISPGGFGWDCYRHYQIPMHGSCPVLISPSIVMHAPFMHGENAYYLMPGSDWKMQLESMLADKQRLIRMTQAAQAHVLRHHTPEGLGAYLVHEIEQLSGSSC